MTDDLLALSDWLAGAGCTHVALKSTCAYSQPIWNPLVDPRTLSDRVAPHNVLSGSLHRRVCESLAPAIS